MLCYNRGQNSLGQSSKTFLESRVTNLFPQNRGVLIVPSLSLLAVSFKSTVRRPLWPTVRAKFSFILGMEKASLAFMKCPKNVNLHCMLCYDMLYHTLCLCYSYYAYSLTEGLTIVDGCQWLWFRRQIEQLSSLQGLVSVLTCLHCFSP